MQVEIWSDVVCPWCYIGKRRFERALADFPGRDEVEVVWRSYELDPGAPAVSDVSPVEHLARKYGVDTGEAAAMQHRVAQAASGEGLEYRLDQTRRGNSFDAHRLVHLAAEHGLQDELQERLFAAYFTEGAAIGDRGTLADLAADVGLDAAEVAEVLDGDRFADAVRDDEETARQLGCTGVPFFVFDRRYGAAGAQDPTLLREILDQAFAGIH
jgi:predicted DsbA family dithiol-disulfide isomerase